MHVWYLSFIASLDLRGRALEWFVLYVLFRSRDIKRSYLIEVEKLLSPCSYNTFLSSQDVSQLSCLSHSGNRFCSCWSQLKCNVL